MAGIKFKKKEKKKKKKGEHGLQNSSFLKQYKFQRFPLSDNQHAQPQTLTSTQKLKITPLMHRIKNRNKYECFSYYTLFGFQNTEVKKQNENA